MTALVIGANGYLGTTSPASSSTTGQDVRVMVRDGANTIGIDDLEVTRFVGDIWNDDVLREAMAGCDVVYYCVVDTRGWLRDPAPLFHTNVEGTRNVLEIAKDAGPATLRLHQQLRDRRAQARPRRHRGRRHRPTPTTSA